MQPHVDKVLTCLVAEQHFAESSSRSAGLRPGLTAGWLQFQLNVALLTVAGLVSIDDHVEMGHHICPAMWASRPEYGHVWDAAGKETLSENTSFISFIYVAVSSGLLPLHISGIYIHVRVCCGPGRVSLSLDWAMQAKCSQAAS